jgi:hypothetical protein
MPKPRIRENFLLMKSKINSYLNSDKVISINDLEIQFLKEKLISVGFDEYIDNKINNKNIIYSLIIVCICGLMALRLSFAAFIKDPYILDLIADPLHLIGDQKTLNLCNAIFVLIGIKVRLIFILGKFLLLRFVYN